MGLAMSRFYNLLDFWPLRRRRRSQQDETMHPYPLNKNYFCNYFYMGGERFEVNDPDYLFGENCDLNFLTCSKPHTLPYKKAQQSLLANISTKQKAINKVSSRINSLSSPLNILTGRHRQVSQSHKQDAQTQTLNNSKDPANGAGPEPSQPLVMFINIRKETLRLIKSSHVHNIDDTRDQNSLTNTTSPSEAVLELKRMEISTSPPTAAAAAAADHSARSQRSHGFSLRNTKNNAASTSNNTSNRHSLTTTTSIHKQDGLRHEVDESIELNETAYYSKIHLQSDSSSITSNTLSSAHSTTTSKSGYRSVKDVPPSECASDENDEFYQDALNEPTSQDDNELVGTQLKPHLPTRDSKQQTTKENDDIRITIHPCDAQANPECSTDLEQQDNKAPTASSNDHHSDTYNEETSPRNKLASSKKTATAKSAASSKKPTIVNGSSLMEETCKHHQATSTTTNRAYNIEFTFDAEVDCYIRIFYFCTREVTSNNVSYRAQHATYKSKTYTYKRGLNQKFEQPEHTFQPYLFDEDLLIYKPLDLDGNYNSGAVFPIVIHCAALEGPTPRQCQSLVATVEKSQLDDGYSIKPLKQLLFVDGVQYILQDIYGIENKPLTAPSNSSMSNLGHHRRSSSRISRLNRNLRSSCGSLYSTSNLGSNMNLSDTASIASAHVVDGSLADSQNRGSLLSTNNQFKSLGSENTFECVICMSEERDTMLLPCRHLCLCSVCAQSLRYQASSCPICRCPFKAALNLRVIQRNQHRYQLQQQQQSWSTSASASNEALANDTTPTTAAVGSAAKSRTTSTKQEERDNIDSSTMTIVRRESVTSSATPLLAPQTKTDVGGGGSGFPVVAADEKGESTGTCSDTQTQCPKSI